MGQTYCDVAPGHEWHGPYHDNEYGFPLGDIMSDVSRKLNDAFCILYFKCFCELMLHKVKMPW
jgi:hypothetical protein